MIVVIGGAYQGKMEYIKNEYGLSAEDIHICTADGEPDFTKRAVYGFHNYIRFILASGKEPDIPAILPMLSDKIIVCDEISAGVVPLDSFERKWREQTGAAMALLCGKSEKVIRVFCAIPTVIKDNA